MKHNEAFLTYQRYRHLFRFQISEFKNVTLILPKRWQPEEAMSDEDDNMKTPLRNWLNQKPANLGYMSYIRRLPLKEVFPTLRRRDVNL